MTSESAMIREERYAALDAAAARQVTIWAAMTDAAAARTGPGKPYTGPARVVTYPATGQPVEHAGVVYTTSRLVSVCCGAPVRRICKYTQPDLYECTLCGLKGYCNRRDPDTDA